MTFELGWLIGGVALVIVELMTGTFYLLILGIAAFGGSLVAWLGGAFWTQAVVAGALAIAGVVFVKSRKRLFQGQGSIDPIDIGQIASFETWLTESDRIARVRYRGATWDALVDGTDDLPGGGTLYVTAVEGTRLRVSPRRP